MGNLPEIKSILSYLILSYLILMIKNSRITSGKVFRDYLNICNETLCSINYARCTMFTEKEQQYKTECHSCSKCNTVI